jgi:hypothetical protein
MTRSSEALIAGRRCIILAALMLSSLATMASGTNYRLAGIVGAAGDGAVALIELPDGRQRLFREGDVLGDGRIRDITAAAVRVELGREDLILRLRGSPLLVASAREEAAPADDEPEPAVTDEAETAAAEDESEAEQDTEHNQQMSASEVTRLLGFARGAGEAGTEAAPRSAETLRAQLNESLEIPAGAQITAVDQVNVSTPQEAIEALASRLDRGGSAQVSVSNAGALETIVITSDAEQ